IHRGEAQLSAETLSLRNMAVYIVRFREQPVGRLDILIHKTFPYPCAAYPFAVIYDVRYEYRFYAMLLSKPFKQLVIALVHTSESVVVSYHKHLAFQLVEHYIHG